MLDSGISFVMGIHSYKLLTRTVEISIATEIALKIVQNLSIFGSSF